MAYQGNDQHYHRYQSDEDEIMEDNGDHGLLAEKTYNFSLLTRQRALIAWIGTGRKNDYFSACRYYHFLEQEEEELSPEARERSRTLEFRTLPMSPHADILLQMFPNLGTQAPPNYAEPSTSRYTSSETILPASIAITNYLQENQIDMGTFLKEFREYADKEGLQSTLNHLLYFITLKNGKAKKQEPTPPQPQVAVVQKPAEVNQIEELNNSFNNLYFGPNAKITIAKPPPHAGNTNNKQKNNKHLKQTNRLNLPPSQGGPGPSHASGSIAIAGPSNGHYAKMNGNKQYKPKASVDDKENLSVEMKKNYAEVAKKHGSKHNTSNSSNNCD